MSATTIPYSTAASSVARKVRRPANESQKARREQRVESLITGLCEELDGCRAGSRRALAIVRALAAHLDAMRRYIAERLEVDLDPEQALDVAQLASLLPADDAPDAWAHVARHHVDRVAMKALAIGELLGRAELDRATAPQAVVNTVARGLTSAAGDLSNLTGACAPTGAPVA